MLTVKPEGFVTPVKLDPAQIALKWITIVMLPLDHEENW